MEEDLKSKYILADADAFISLLKKDDVNHEKAMKIAERFEQEGKSILISPFTIGEVVTVLSWIVSQDSAKLFLRFARKRNFTTVPLSEDLAEIADKVFLKQEKKRTSYFDCYNMAIMRSFKLKGIFSFDKIYTRNGFILHST